MAQATLERLYDASGAEAKKRADALAEPQATTQAACLELHNGTVTFVIEATINPNSYPFVVSGGQIKSGICGAPWDITGGFLGPSFRLDAKRKGSGSCANTITIVGEEQGPPSWRGTYGFDGASSWFKHTTLFRGWMTCP
jgi:hypothetical protein